jgi:DNA repair protein RadC
VGLQNCDKGVEGLSIHAGHRKRLKDRFIREGIDHFEEHQILEILLFYGIPRKDTNEIAHRLIKEFKDLAGVLDATVEDLRKVEGVGENAATLLAFLAPLSRRYQSCKFKEKRQLNSSQKAGEYAMHLFTDLRYECFYLICLNNQNQVRHAVKTFEGTINEAAVYPRLVVETALKYQASSVIIAHNHPGGSIKPSQGDIQVTKRIKEALDAIDIKVIDHIIVGDNRYYSFAEDRLVL